VHIPGAQLPFRMDEVPAGPLVVMCGGGYRSTIAASFLAREGRDGIANLAGGIDAYRSAGLPITTEVPASPAEVA
jgi:hydroxyacylglutathione hydrolase